MVKFRSPLDKLANHDCTRCELHEYTDRVCVMGDGDWKSGIMILGEAPGGEEERTGRVFSGRAGQVLDSALDTAGISREDVYVSNVVKCRPPDNDRPDRIHWEACRRYLERERRRVRPHSVLLLGNTALQAIARKSGITKHRGKRLAIRDDGWSDATVMATIHPAFVLRNPGQQSVFTEDVRRFARAVKGDFQAVKVKPVMVRTGSQLKALRKYLMKAEEVSYDVENYLSPWQKGWRILVLGITVDGERVFVLPLGHPDSPFRRRWKDVLTYLKPALQRPGLKLVAQSGKHDNLQLAGAGLYLEHTFDLMLAAHVLDENRPKNLGFLSQTILGADEYKGMVETKPDRILGEDLRALARYNAYDVGYTHQIKPKLKKELVEQPRLARLFVKLMMPASHTIQQVETRGIYCDQAVLWDRIDKLEGFINEEREVIGEFLPRKTRADFNPNSTQQLGRWLFGSKKRGGLGLNPLEYTKSGAPSTKQAVLLHYRHHPAVVALLRYRTLQLKWMNTYFLPWAEKLDARSRLHTFYKIYGTVTGRLSGDFQQVPRDNFVRSVFGAPSGWKFISADLAQAELRIAAHIAQERRMIRAFETGEDIHSLTASVLTGKPQEKLTKEERKRAKAVNFGFLYGMYPKKFQTYAFENYDLIVSRGEAERFRERFFNLYPDLPAWHERQKRIVRAQHWVQSPIGRVRHLPDILSGDNSVRMEAERQAINSPVQSMASDLVLYAMTKLDEVLDTTYCFMTMTLHDQVGLECKNSAVDEHLELIKHTMENLPLTKTFGAELTVPVVADVEATQMWEGFEDASGLGVRA